jgi:hypothetical protein
MQYADLGGTGLRVSRISLGMEHVVKNLDAVQPVVDAAVEAGVNYFDMMFWTAETKRVAGQALARHRDRIVIAGHIGCAEQDGQYRKTRDVPECESLWQELTQAVGTDYVDIGFVTFIDDEADYDEVRKPGGVLDLAKRMKADGRIGHIAMSGHEPALALRCIEDGWVDLVMQCIQIGASGDLDTQRLCAACASRGIGLVSMKVFYGGTRFSENPGASPLPFIHYALAQPGMSTALLGARSVEELQADLAYWSAPDTEKDYAALVPTFAEGLSGTCVYCSHCQPCPVEIDIAEVHRRIAAERSAAAGVPRVSWPEPGPADCIACGDCEPRCPFDVPIIENMQAAAAT